MSKIKIDKVLIESSKLYGILAFEKGKKAIPCTDNDFCENILKGLKVGEGAVDYMKAWISGWTDANLKEKI